MSEQRITKAAIGERIEAVEKKIQLYWRNNLDAREIRLELAEVRFLIERDVFFPQEDNRAMPDKAAA